MRVYFAFALFACLGLVSCGKSDEKQAVPAGPRVTVVKVATHGLQETLLASGTLVARSEVRVTAQVEGLSVLSLNVDAGDHVKQGDVLAVLDDKSFGAQMAQNTANLARATAGVVESRRALARTTALKNKGYSTSQQLDERINAARAATADEAAMQAMRDDLQTKMSRTKIIAPTAGLIASRNAKIGMIASAVDPLFILIADTKVELEAQISDTQHNRVHEGQSAAVTVPGFETPITGSVRLVSPQIDPATRLGTIRVSLDSEKPVSVGGYARAEITVAKREALAVPLSGVSYQNGKASVQKVVDDKVVTTPVKTGIVSDDGFVEILEGLKADENIVSKAGTFLRDGDLITPVSDGA